MRIGLISGEFPPLIGGVGAFSSLLARAAADLGHAVFVLSDTRAQSDDDRIPVASVISAGQWNRRCYSRIRQWVIEQRLDVINLQYQTAAYAMSPWIHFLPGRLRPCPVVTTFHDLRFPYLFPKAGPLRPWIVRHLASTSAGVIATNHEDFAAISGHPHAALVPIGSNIPPQQVPASDRTEWRLKTGTSPTQFLIAFFGFINQSKGLDTVIDALAQARGAGRDWRLVIIGDPTGASDPTNARYADSIREQIRSREVEEQIFITGFVPDSAVAGYLAAADAIALPYRDGVSLRRGTLMAALQSGTPIVTTHPRVSIPEFDGALLTVAPEQPDQLFRALSRLQEDADLCRSLTAQAARLAASFDWTRIAELTVDHLQRVVAAHHRVP